MLTRILLGVGLVSNLATLVGLWIAYISAPATIQSRIAHLLLVIGAISSVAAYLAIAFVILWRAPGKSAAPQPPPTQAPPIPASIELLDVALIWDWTEDEKKLLSPTESSKDILVHNRSEREWIYHIQVAPISLYQTMTFDPIHELGPGAQQALVGRWNGRSSVSTEYACFFTSTENEAVAASRGWKHEKPHNRGVNPVFLRIPVKLTFQDRAGKTSPREFDFVHDQGNETRFEKHCQQA